MSEAVGVIVAAIIAGLVAFFSLIISKEQTVSNFRQQWIDELRKDIAAVASCVSSIHGESIAKHKDDQVLWDRVKTDFTRFKEVIVRIRLRLNPHEKRKIEGPATKAVLGVLTELEAIFGSATPQFHKLEALLATLVTNANVILKKNWQRVRSGERIYQVTKWLTLSLTVAVVIAWLLHVFKVI
jgi:hypothetical protein